MKAYVRQSARVLLALGVLGVGADLALGFSAQGHRWNNDASTPVSYRLQPDGAPGVTDGSDLLAIRRAFATWDSVACSYLSFREDPWVDPSVVQADNTNRIFWATEQGEWDESQRSTLAFTYTFYTLDTNLIQDADIIVNGVYWEWTTVDSEVTENKVDVETVLFHEIGHFFGLDHSTDQSAAMFPSNNKGVQRAPASDDINGICALYSNGEEVPGTNGKGAVGAPCQANGDCASSICAADSVVGRNYCTAECAPNQDICGPGYQCTNTPSGNYCLAPAPVDELCDQCNDGNQCASGLCTTVDGKNNFQPFCTRACDPSTPGQCPSGYACQAIFREGITGGVCSPVSGVCDPVGRGGHNEPCYANGGCKAGHICVEYNEGGGELYCYAQCSNPGASCSTESMREVCLDVRGRPNIYACFTIAKTGEVCNPEVCESGSFCLFDENVGPASSICYQECETRSCNANEQCVFVNDLGLGVCVANAGFKLVGDGCLSDAECESRTCRTYLGASLCTQPCATTDPASCPAGHRCVPGQDSEQGLCWPESFLDPNARDEIRDVSFSACACNTTIDCDPDCDCDTDCGADGGGCSCDAASDERSGEGWVGLLALFGLWALRRRSGSGSIASC